MNDKVRIALEISIKKWKANTVAQTPDDYRVSTYDCPLCILFHGGHNNPESCKGCPVMADTGLPFCVGTPYDKAHKARDFWRGAVREETRAKRADLAREAAKEEVQYLKSLLPVPE